MPVYEFDCEGERIEREFRISDCPRSIEWDGRTYTKVSAYRVGVICDGANSKWENDRHRGAAIKEARRTGKALRTEPDAYPVTIGADEGGKVPEFVRSETDWVRKNG